MINSASGNSRDIRNFSSRLISALALSLALVATPVFAQDKEKPKGPPPASVVVAKAMAGEMAPMQSFVGSVFFPEVSEVAAQTSGIVEAINFREGERLAKGALMVDINADVLKTIIKANRANRRQASVEVEKAAADFKRYDKLYKENSVALQVYDEKRFDLQALKQRLISTRADLERLETELKQKQIFAPFDGLVVRKHAARGGWLSAGTSIATFARIENMEVVVNVPENLLPQLVPDLEVEAEIGGKKRRAVVMTVIPQGDIATRSFPIKLRVETTDFLIEGMKATVSLPSGDREQALLVPRDAVLNKYGRDVVVVVRDGSAASVGVRVLGFQGPNAGVSGEGLAAGDQVVIKGNERVRDGQAVMIVEK